jgi:hypothetical protein
MQREPKFATVVERMCSEPTVRRQFLWLRAQEKGDMETVRGLEAVEPALRSHMAALVAAFEARGNPLDTPDERRRSFGRMQDELFEQYAKTLE